MWGDLNSECLQFATVVDIYFGKLGDLAMSEILVGTDSNVNTGDTPLLSSVGEGRFDMFESLLEVNTDVKVVRRDGASALTLSIFSSNPESDSDDD